MTAALFALFLGLFGAHKFYMGSWGWGAVFFLAGVFTAGGAWAITFLVGLFEFVQFIGMSDDAFAEKYPSETQAPFRW
jgi:TM2 domain-containing membrane protein YozV